MHVHFDPMGGVAGDMFVAAVLDAFPGHAEGLRSALETAALDRFGTIEVVPHDDGTLTGSRAIVRGPDEPHPHRTFVEIRALLEAADLEPGVRARAVDIFTRLASAEGAVHGRDPEEVTFHEVGAWDSILDIVAAAWLIEAVSADTWSSGPLPLGSGRVDTAHGPLPVPAPATAALLGGVPLVRDGVEGERVTPTGAAILAHLDPSYDAIGELGTLERVGVGFGTRELIGVPNLLRVLAFRTAGAGSGGHPARSGDRVVVCEFEVDDQTPEDLAVALERLRGVEGVIDVVHAPVVGKGGRLAAHVRLLARPAARESVLDACFAETSTLGVRWRTVDRAILERAERIEERDGRRVRVKAAVRPSGRRTEKADIGDLAPAGDRARREGLRRAVERPPDAEGE